MFFCDVVSSRVNTKFQNLKLLWDLLLLNTNTIPLVINIVLHYVMWLIFYTLTKQIDKLYLIKQQLILMEVH